MLEDGGSFSGEQWAVVHIGKASVERVLDGDLDGRPGCLPLLPVDHQLLTLQFGQ